MADEQNGNATTVEQTGPVEGGQQEAKFSQGDLDRIVQKRLADERKKFSDYEDLKGKVDELSKVRDEYEALKEQSDLKGKNDNERELARIQKELSSLKNALSERDKRLQERESALEAERGSRLKLIKERQISDALSANSVLAGAGDDALSSFQSTAEIELDDNGNIIAIDLAGQRFNSVKEATAKFLEMKPHFASAGAGGSGTRRPNGAGATPPNLSEMPAHEAIASGLRDRMNRTGRALG